MDIPPIPITIIHDPNRRRREDGRRKRKRPDLLPDGEGDPGDDAVHGEDEDGRLDIVA